MKARMPKTYDQLTTAEKKKLYSAVYADVAHKSAIIVTKLADEIASLRTGVAIDIGCYAGMITAIDKLGVGTDASRLAGRESRLQKFADGYYECLGEAGERYDECLLEGLRYQLRVRGVETPELEPYRKPRTIEQLEGEIKKAIQNGEEEKA